jgi:hypothetical protein
MADTVDTSQGYLLTHILAFAQLLRIMGVKVSTGQ